MARVVLADDEEFVRYFLKSTLEDFDYKVVAEAKNGSELIEAMKEHNPDILLLDINMPKMNGIEFLKKYSSNYEWTCIIMLTSVANDELKKECEENGAKYFLRKDTEVLEMMQIIENTWTEFKEEQW